ncbi:hypothetical protein ACW9YV_27865 (plasmid) [Paraburkholderia strydomiana]
MRSESHKTKLSILMDHVDAWRQRLGSREAVALEIVAAHKAWGGDRLPKLDFDMSGDTFTCAKNAADRIFRWLDDKSKDVNFLPANFERSILAAMPDDLRMSFLNEYLAPFGLVVHGIEAKATMNATAHLVRIAKESADAQGAIANLIDGATPAELLTADRELGEAEEALRVARADVRQQLNLKAVA